MFAAVLAQVSRCATASLCPTNQDLHDAIYDRAAEAAASWANAHRSDNPNEILLAEVHVIGRVGDVHCSAPLADEPSSITCSFTTTRRSSVTYRIAKLTRHDGRWAITDSLAVDRSINPRK